MRQYRGLTKEGKWVYGWYYHWNSLGKDFIMQQHINSVDIKHCEVIPETVGQFVTKDENGTDVFEGDKIKALYFWPDTFKNPQTITGKVGWRDETFNWVLYHTPNTPECVELWQLDEIELIEDEEDE